jgi:hypothetical protein
VAVTFPTNGFSLVVSSPFVSTNLNAIAAINDPAGITSAEYALDGASLVRKGTLAPPYQFSLTNLLPGDYLLTVSAVNSAGLVTSTHVSFSVISSAPEMQLVEAKPLVPSGFQFAVTGLKGTSYELQAASNVLVWDRLSLWTNFDGAVRVTDSNAPQFSARYYRILQQ